MTLEIKIHNSRVHFGIFFHQELKAVSFIKTYCWWVIVCINSNKPTPGSIVMKKQFFYGIKKVGSDLLSLILPFHSQSTYFNSWE